MAACRRRSVVVEFRNATVAIRSIILGSGRPVHVEVPNPRPAEFVVISASGGQPLAPVLRRRLWMVDCWAPTKFAAENLALDVLDTLDGVFNRTVGDVLVASAAPVGDVVDMPDPDTGIPRARVNIEAIIRAI